MQQTPQSSLRRRQSVNSLRRELPRQDGSRERISDCWQDCGRLTAQRHLEQRGTGQGCLLTSIPKQAQARLSQHPGPQQRLSKPKQFWSPAHYQFPCHRNGSCHLLRSQALQRIASTTPAHLSTS